MTTEEKIFVLLYLIGTVALSLGIISLLVWGICWAFGIVFSWKLVVGAFLINILVNLLFGGVKK